VQSIQRPPSPPLRPIPSVPVRFQVIRKTLIASLLKGDDKSFENELNSVPLTPSQIIQLLNFKFEEIQNHTLLFFAITGNFPKICKIIVQKGADPEIESAYNLAKKKVVNYLPH